MTDITQYLNGILTEENGEDVLSAIVSIMTALKTDRYTTADVDTYIGIIQNGVYGKSVKGAIYNALVALSSVEPTGTPFEPESDELILVIEESTIDNKEYGRDIRQAIHDALLKLACYKVGSEPVPPGPPLPTFNWDESRIGVVAITEDYEATGDAAYFDNYSDALSYVSNDPFACWIHEGNQMQPQTLSSSLFADQPWIGRVDLNGQTTLPDDLFYCFEWSGSAILKYVTGLNNVVTIGEGTFWDQTSLEVAIFSNSLTTIGRMAFLGCESLTSFTIPSSVTSIGEQAFSGSGLTSITIPGSIDDIEEDTFASCVNLASVTIRSGVKTIGSRAFASTAITSITIPSSVTSIEDGTGHYTYAGAFSECSNLTSIIVEKTENSISGAPWGATNATVTWTG